MAMLNSPDLQALLSMGVALTVAKLCSVWLHVELVLLGIALVSCWQLNVFICPIPFFVVKKNIFIENILMEN